MGAQRELWDTLILLFLFGMNIGAKLFFRHRDDEHRMKELERANLHHTLTQLRYQLNPHLLMNTLNNIHSLIDIDPVVAQEAVVELSRLLRFVLYDADRERVLLRHDLEFIQHYVALMRVRYADTVRIDMRMPDVLPDVEVPPLLFISFVENAFKHGVSYQKESFIEIEESLSDDISQLHFSCRNSNHGASTLEYGGVGLSNVRQRLKLLYGEDYTLEIDNDPKVYTVRLTIPLTRPATQAEKE